VIAAAFLAAVLAIHPAPAAKATKLSHFQSPSGNINCLGGPAESGSPAFVQCLVRRNTWPARITPRRPASCDLDFDAHTVTLANGRPTVGSCRGDIGPLCVGSGADRCFTLAYGRSVTMGSIKCTSLMAGVECRYRTSPYRGFRIARETYILYR
jgi:hypothetical protein